MVTLPGGPVKAFDVDLDALPAVPPVEGGRARVLVRRHGAPVTVCVVDVPSDGLTPAQFAEQLKAVPGLADVAEAVGEDRRARRRELVDHGPHLTVQIATRDRPGPLRRCLESIAAVDYRAFDIIVIDNASRTDDARGVVAAFGRAHPEVAVRYLREPVAGASRAHNRGLAVAEGEWVVRTDDDVVVDRGWLAAIADAATSGVGVECVTGLILPAEIETPAQELLEQFGGYARGFARRRVDMGGHRPRDPLFPFTTGRLGSGANIAFAAAGLRARGGFDCALGPGTRARGGEDLLALFEVLAGGGGVVYEPGAMVWHWNRRDYASLQRLMHDYGLGLAAYLTAAVVRRPRLALGMVGQVMGGVRHVVGRSSAKNRAKRGDYPRELERRELWGMVAGPVAYLLGRLTGGSHRPVVSSAGRSREVAR